jgi:transposase
VCVGMDVHRKRSQVAVVDEAGNQQRNRNLPNDPAKLVPILGVIAGGHPARLRGRLRLGWPVELLEELEPHLVHPSRCKAIASTRLKNDKVDAATLAQLLREDQILWTGPGRAWLAELELPPIPRAIIQDCCGLLDALATPPAWKGRSPALAKPDPRVQALVTIAPGSVA